MSTETLRDIIVVGARCAGAPLAMLLARQGHRVLLVDKAAFPSDVISTHVIHPQGVACLERWGLLDQVVASGCPPVDTYAYHFGPVTITGSPGVAESRVAYAPRRTVLDKILVDAAVVAGVEVREQFHVERVIVEQGRVVGIRGHGRDGVSVVERAAIIVGADGRWSRVARAVDALVYNEKPTVLASYYSYWSGLPMHGRFEVYVHVNRGFAAVETNDGLTMIVAGWPFVELDAYKRDLEHNWRETLELAPAFAERLRGATQESRLVGMPVPNFFRKPYGPGWVLVGDAGYVKDPITAQGISDAFRDAEHCASALHDVLLGRRAFDNAMSEYQRIRDEHAMPMYEMTWQIATLAPPPPEMQQVVGACSGNQDAMDAFVRMNAGTMWPPDFFAPTHLGPIMARAAAGVPA